MTAFLAWEKGVRDERGWLTKLGLDFQSENGIINGWSSHHASQERALKRPPGINSLAPLLHNKVETFAMQAHCMIIKQKTVEVLNPGQTPVDHCDCPVYAISKTIQFRYPSLFQNYLSMLGDLHSEQVFLVMHGELINGSGLKELMKIHKFTTINVSSVVDASQIKAARYGLQVLLSALFLKLQDACKDSGMDPFVWLDEKAKSNDMCFILNTLMQFQINVLLFVRSIREGNLSLYIEVLRKFLPWFICNRSYFLQAMDDCLFL